MARRAKKLPIKEKFCKHLDMLRYNELILYSNCQSIKGKLHAQKNNANSVRH